MGMSHDARLIPKVVIIWLFTEFSDLWSEQGNFKTQFLDWKSLLSAYYIECKMATTKVHSYESTE